MNVEQPASVALWSASLGAESTVPELLENWGASTLAWKIPWMEEPGRLQSMGSRRVGHDWATSLSLFSFMHWRRKWQPTPVFLPGESQGWGSLVGCRLWGRRVGHDWSDLAADDSELVCSQFCHCLFSWFPFLLLFFNSFPLLLPLKSLLRIFRSFQILLWFHFLLL